MFQNRPYVRPVRRAERRLSVAGWTVLRVWEHERQIAAADRTGSTWTNSAPRAPIEGAAGPRRRVESI